MSVKVTYSVEVQRESIAQCELQNEAEDLAELQASGQRGFNSSNSLSAYCMVQKLLKLLQQADMHALRHMKNAQR